MKRNISFIISLRLLACFMLACTNAFAQHDQSSLEKGRDNCTPLGQIDAATAMDRITFFRTHKRDFIEHRYANAQDIVVTKQEMIRFLNLVKTGHDGLRIYFALIPKSKFTLVFVPTNSSSDPDDDDATAKISSDDENNVYFVNNNGVFTKLTNPVTFKKWINKNTNRIAPHLEDELVRQSFPRYRETHSLWYSRATLFDDSNSLFDFLSHCSKVKEVKIDFASWVDEPKYPDYVHKNDLIFEMDVSPNEPLIFSTFGKIEIEKYRDSLQQKYDSIADKGSKEAEDLLKEINVLNTKLRNQTEYADTGIPCPPAKCP